MQHQTTLICQDCLLFARFRTRIQWLLILLVCFDISISRIQPCCASVRGSVRIGAKTVFQAAALRNILYRSQTRRSRFLGQRTRYKLSAICFNGRNVSIPFPRYNCGVHDPLNRYISSKRRPSRNLQDAPPYPYVCLPIDWTSCSTVTDSFGIIVPHRHRLFYGGELPRQLVFWH